ncbi:putative extracellular endoglucanase/cellulase [Aspergillus saccharolyticus JOP 1030-1]|uniref:cellulase n=1 Tax=Aspergillus saccharolyticus JOP 1030-1 TaxID=1450539 RepID=A0A318Z7M8_9EURO|nr:glycoside hydrolase [Aspergillus saccharolyticus JOP 1030-1]PYH43176.1 glycoside hydrolase [Aspergillus saccharolyticus JOP 1030-1]
MRISNLVIAASAAGMVNALPKREIKKRSSGFTFFGVSESGAEFGSGVGTLGTTYTWPTTSQIQILRDAGMNLFRIPFLMERLTPDSITGSFASTYLSDLKSTVKFVTDSGAYAVLDPHNYGRYDGSIITSTSDFQTWWKNVAAEFADNEKVIFDTNNEYHDMEQSLVLSLNQAAIDGIRAAGATSQYIFVEGNSYSGAWTWTEYNDDLSGLTDTEDKIIYEMHQYLDSDASGTSETCVSSTIGKERLESATEWLQTNSKKGIIGEFAGAVNTVCEEAVEGMLSYMSENSDVWVGASWWSAGPWWGSYMYSIEPSDGPAYSTYLPILEKYFPDGNSTTASSSAAASVASATSAVEQTTTAAPHPEVSTTSAVSVAAAAPSSSSAATTFATSTKSKSPCRLHSTSAAASASASAPASATSIVVVSQPTTTVVAVQQSTTAVAVQQSTTAVVVEQPTTTAAAVAATTPVVTPSPVTSSVVAASGSAGVSDPQGAEATNSAGQVKQYYQCGGINWTGPTECESPYTCVEQNAYYYQCVASN